MKQTAVGESFRRRADSAAFFEAWVGSVLARGGLWTTHHPFTIAESGRDIPAYAHTWDLDVGAVDPVQCGDDRYGGPWPLKVEVKSLSQSFNGPADYPFTSLLVCSQKSFLKKWPGAECTRRDFLFVSTQTGAIIWLPSGTKVQLGCEVMDKTRNELYKAVRAARMDIRSLDEFVTRIREEGEDHGF